MQCQGCKTTIETKTGAYNIGKRMKETKWHPVMDGAGDIYWFCPVCSEKLHLLGKQILEICPDLYYCQINQLLSKDPG